MSEELKQIIERAKEKKTITVYDLELNTDEYRKIIIKDKDLNYNIAIPVREILELIYKSI